MDDSPVIDVAFPSATKDEPHMSPEWDRDLDLIDGVRLREVRHVVTHNGVTTELHRRDWGVVGAEIEQIIHVALRPGSVSAWHMHERKTDHLFVVTGMIKAVLFDGRPTSQTFRKLNVLIASPMRPTLIVIPPGVWHGLANIGPVEACFVNFFDEAYDYTAPDDWRMPPDTDDVPYRF